MQAAAKHIGLLLARNAGCGWSPRLLTSCTKVRLPAVQHCPDLNMTAWCAASTAAATPASFHTITGDLPPSSSVTLRWKQSGMETPYTHQPLRHQIEVQIAADVTPAAGNQSQLAPSHSILHAILSGGAFCGCLAPDDMLQSLTAVTAPAPTLLPFLSPSKEIPGCPVAASVALPAEGSRGSPGWAGDAGASGHRACAA